MAFRFPFLSSVQRHALIALYALQQELNDVVEDCSDANVALTTLRWWEQQLDKLYNSDSVPEHPLLQALKPFITRYSLPLAEILALPDALRTQLTQARFQNMEQLCHYSKLAGMVQGRLTSRVLGFSAEQTLDFADKVGEICQLVMIYSRIGADTRLGKLYIPVELLQQFNVPAHLVLNRHGGVEFTALMNAWLATLKQQFNFALALLPSADNRRQRPSLAMLSVAWAQLNEIEQDGLQNIMQYQLVVPRPRQQRLFWKTWLCGFRPV